MASEIKVNTIKDLGGNTIVSSNGSGTISGLPASAISSGTVATARLGSGTASSSTFLAGDSSYKTVSGTTINNNADNRIITGSGTANTLEGEANLTFNGSQLTLPTGSAGSPSLAHAGDTDTGIYFATNNVVFATAGNNRVELLADGNLSIRQENLKFETANKGVYLGTTTGASSNLLNDFETGTFTPGIAPTSGSFSAVGTCNGFYTKIGNIVNIQMELSLTDKGSGSGNIDVNNLPFTSASTGIVHTNMLCRETQTNGSVHNVIMSRDVTALVLLAPHMANGAGYSVNGVYRV